MQTKLENIMQEKRRITPGIGLWQLVIGISPIDSFDRVLPNYTLITRTSSKLRLRAIFILISTVTNNSATQFLQRSVEFFKGSKPINLN